MKENKLESQPLYGPQVKRPLRIRVLQVASILLAVAGLILLYLYSVNRDISTVQVADITPTMNFATVKVSGTITRNAYVFRSGGVVFNLHDGSGEIAVLGGRAQAEALEKSGKLPRVGDQVNVTGSLSISADQDAKLRMQSADQMILLRMKKPTSKLSQLKTRIALADVTPAQEGNTVSVIGTLKKITIPTPGSNAPYVLTLEENGAELGIIFWDSVFQGLEQKLPTLGKIFSVRGRVDVYREAVQLKVWDATDLREINEEEERKGGEYRISNIEQGTAEGTVPSMGGVPEGRGGFSLSHQSATGNRQSKISSIADITVEQEGQVVTIVGALGEPTSIRGGVIYPIVDDSGEIVVLFWDNQVSGEERDALESGIQLRVTAPLVIYKGILELVPTGVGAFRVELPE